MLSYMVLTATLAFHHEPWRDEVDSWLMARDASLATIVRISPDMGTPVGWYFLLKPFASIGLPFATQQALTLVLIWTAVAILIFQSPFSILVSTCWCLSWYLSFEYSVMSRNYTLGVLGVFALLGSYSASCSSRLKAFQWWVSWPLVTFSSVHFLALTPGLMALSYSLDRRLTPKQERMLLKYSWPLLLTSLCIWILWPTGHGQMGSVFSRTSRVVNFQRAISLGVFPFLSVEGVSRFIAPVFVCCWLLVCRCGIKETFALTLMLIGVNSIFVFSYFLGAWRHCGLNWILLIGIAWVGLSKSRLDGWSFARKQTFVITTALIVVTLINIRGSTTRWREEIRRPFTDAGATARYLTESGLIQEPIACRVPPLCSSILGYIPTPVRFWYPGIDQWGTHMFWDRAYAISTSLPADKALVRARNFLHNVQGHGSFLFLSHEPMPNPGALGLTKIWESPQTAWLIRDERFSIYRWQANEPLATPLPTPLPQGSAETR
ncbi:MAG: hypothetical protein RL326_1555 [Pseudomonadota bacterium]|jgi:hypothetical protein